MGISLQDAQRNPRLAAAMTAQYGTMKPAPVNKTHAQRAESAFPELAGRSFP